MINVIGLGYIGLPTALMLAASGNRVVGTDYNNSIVRDLNNSKLTFKEDGLSDLFESAKQGGIEFSTEYQETDFYIVAVPTPYEKANKKIDAKYVVAAVKNVLSACKENAIVVVESTISPGTFDGYIRPLTDVCGKKVYLAHAPERIIPGNMVKELVNNNRIIGADNPEIGAKVREVYKTFCKGEIVVTDIKTAEMSKVVENTYRDINIAFANELAKICREANLDVYEVIRIANMHPRVNVLQPGPGVGGHCISVDPWFLVGDYPGLANLILTARKTNDSMPEYVLGRIRNIMDENGIADVSRVGLYGLTYKEDVDDVRESPTLQLLALMKKHLAMGIKVYDPFIEDDIVDNQYHNFKAFLKDVDVVVIMVAHQHLKDNKRLLKGKFVLDTKNAIEADYAEVYKL